MLQASRENLPIAFLKVDLDGAKQLVSYDSWLEF